VDVALFFDLYGIAYFYPYHLLVLTEKTVKIKAGILETFFEDDLTEMSSKIQSCYSQRFVANSNKKIFTTRAGILITFL
jgi:hypothetical protein